MKCDELKSLKNIEIAFNTTTQQEQVIAEDSEGNCYGFDSWEEVYLKDEVDAAIAELKQKLDEYVLVKLSTQQMLQNLLDCGLIKEWYFNGKFNFVLKADDPHLQIKELNAKLKESEEARYEAGADAADYYQDNRRLKRALYKACANWALSTLAWLDCIDQGEPRMWSKMRQKCLKKAEEYK